MMLSSRATKPDSGRRVLSKSNAHFNLAETKLPLGVADTYRYWGDEKTIYIERGRGAFVWDIDGNEYIDYRLAYGPIILGYCDREVDAAAAGAMSNGVGFGLSVVAEYEVARLVSELVPSAELVRFSNSGTEAVMAALRIARGYTGKDSYVVVEGSFHGLFDAVMWRANMEDWSPNSASAPDTLPFGKGVPSLTKAMHHSVPLNDANALEDVFRRNSTKIAALLIEPIMGNCCSIAATSQYMQDVRSLCSKYEVLLIIDEVKTGFRVAKGGAQELYGVAADLCTFAKAIANGYPLAAVAGRREIMSCLTADGVMHGGTYTASPIALAAATATLNRIQSTDALSTIRKYGENYQGALSSILSHHGIAHCFTGHPSMFGVMFMEDQPTNYRDWKNADVQLYDELARELPEHGILVEPDSREPWFICEAHSEIPLDVACDRLDQALTTIESRRA